MLNIPRYGSNGPTQTNWQAEARKAILAADVERLQEIARDHSVDVLAAAAEGGSVDPAFVATHCEQLRASIIEQVASLQNGEPFQQQQPETILELARLPGVDPQSLFSALLSSCFTFSLQAVLGGLDLYEASKIEEFVIQKSVSDGNCKPMHDLSLYYTGYDRSQWASIFIQNNDVYGAVIMANEGRLDHSDIDNALMAVVVREAGDVTSPLFDVALASMFQFVEVAQDKADLTRFEDFLIQTDRGLQGKEEQLDDILIQYVRLVPTRDAVRDYMTVKKVMQS